MKGKKIDINDEILKVFIEKLRPKDKRIRKQVELIEVIEEDKYGCFFG